MEETSQRLNLQKLSTRLASLQMWPIGYIIDSPYSPLYLEQQVDFNWRDKFEDLLALEAGGSMISSKNRKAEDALSAYRRYIDSSWSITQAIRAVQGVNEEHLPALSRRHQAALKRQDYRMAEEMEIGRSRMKRYAANMVADAKELKDIYEKIRDATASSMKNRGQWMASLITSGALPTWTSHVSNTMNGHVVHFSKQHTDPKVEPGLRVSEFELKQHFEQGQPCRIAEPTPLPEDQVKILLTAPRLSTRVPSTHPCGVDLQPSQTSVIAQAARTETLKLPDGSSVIKILLTNTLANGTSVTKQFV
ncbi:MAG: hypothetical protein Q9228_007167 [Teloschistes exilis]